MRPDLRAEVERLNEKAEECREIMRELKNKGIQILSLGIESEAVKMHLYNGLTEIVEDKEIVLDTETYCDIAVAKYERERLTVYELSDEEGGFLPIREEAKK